MKCCQDCDGRAYPADVSCQRCGATIVPPPPPWLAWTGRVFRVLIAFTAAAQLYHGGRFVLTHTDAGRYVLAHWTDLGGFALAVVVAPLLAVYFWLRALVDIGDWLELKTQQWRAERFRKYGW
jgi:hypothetical protein